MNIVCLFVSQLDSLRARVFSSAKPKVLFGKPVNGAMLASLARIYCDALNSNTAPEIRNAWERVAEQQCQEAADRAVSLYRGLMAGGLSAPDGTQRVLETSELDKLHATSTAAALQLFEAEAVKVCACI